MNYIMHLIACTGHGRHKPKKNARGTLRTQQNMSIVFDVSTRLSSSIIEERSCKSDLAGIVERQHVK